MGIYGIGGIVDVETTGFNAKYEEIVEICLVLFSFNRNTGEIMEIVDEYSGLREPSVPIKKGAYVVHGITRKAVRNMSLDHERIETMLEKAEFIVAHNAKFDKGFLERLFPTSKSKLWLCSMSGINWKEKGFTSKGLQNLLLDHDISVARKHRAEDDVKGLLQLLSKRGHAGKYYFFELLQRAFAEYYSSSEETAATGDC